MEYVMYKIDMKKHISIWIPDSIVLESFIFFFVEVVEATISYGAPPQGRVRPQALFCLPIADELET